MDKRFFSSIGLKFNRPRWQVYLGLLVGTVVFSMLMVMLYIITVIIAAYV